MYRRVPCDWFLCDGIFRKVRLDAPMQITEALTDAGVISADGSCLDRLANEWIYRRAWTYSADFSMQADSCRIFLKLTNLAGDYRITLNNTVLEGSEFEVTGLIRPENHIEITFLPDTSFAIKPRLGFSGMLMFKKTGEATLTELLLREDGSVRATVDSGFSGQMTFRYSLSGSDAEITEKVEKGTGVFEHKPFDGLKSGGRNDVILGIYIRNAMSDEISACIYIPEIKSTGRGFVTENEAIIGLSSDANANTVFGRNRDSALNVLAARHGLSCTGISETETVRAPEAMQTQDRLLSICGRADLIDNPAVWSLTGADKARYDEISRLTSSGDIDAVIAISRCIQAIELKNTALDARIEGRTLAIEGVDYGLEAPASCALIDDIRHPRPAFYALKAAWQKRYAFTRLSNDVPEDGIFSCDVSYVTDEPEGVAEIKVTAYDMKGKQINSSSYAASGRLARVGRFVSEMPGEGVCLIRAALTSADGMKTVSDEIVFAEGRSFADLDRTQILIKDDCVVNTGSSVAAYTCIPEAGFFGCLLPGEEVRADRADEAEGVNIYL